MALSRWTLYIFLLMIMVTGCSDSRPGTTSVVAKAGKAAVDGLHTRVGELERRLSVARWPGHEFYENLRTDISALPQADRERVFEHVRRRFALPDFKAGTLAERSRLFEGYTSNVRELVLEFCALLEPPVVAWEHMLALMEMYELEKRRVAARLDEYAPPPMGLHIPPQEYMRRIDMKKFTAIREAFEGRLFGRFFHGLSEAEQKDWLSRIEKAAGRKVVVFDPAHPDRPLPRPQVRPQVRIY